MSNTPHLGPVPQRTTVDAEQVRQLVTDQFPQWAHLPVRPVPNGGWDNWTFHLGDEMLVRLPSASEYALAVDKEQRWLPVLAPRLPLPIPVPLANGQPGTGYPYSWSIYQWLDGEPAIADRIADPVRFAVDLAGFLAALQSVDTTDAPRPGKHNWFRERLSVDEPTWARGRGWALWKTLVTCAGTLGRADEEAANALCVLGVILSEYLVTG